VGGKGKGSRLCRHPSIKKVARAGGRFQGERKKREEGGRNPTKCGCNEEREGIHMRKEKKRKNIPSSQENGLEGENKACPHWGEKGQ